MIARTIKASVCLSLYGRVTVIKSQVIPKLVCICSLMPVPDEIVKELNQLVYKFLWNGTDKVTRLSTINEYDKYDKGGLKMTDLECMIKSLRLAWLQRVFNANQVPWKWYLSHILTKFGVYFCLTVIMILMTFQFLHYFILNLCSGGLSFAKTLLTPRTGLI